MADAARIKRPAYARPSRWVYACRGLESPQHFGGKPFTLAFRLVEPRIYFRYARLMRRYALRHTPRSTGSHFPMPSLPPRSRRGRASAITAAYDAMPTRAECRKSWPGAGSNGNLHAALNTELRHDFDAGFNESRPGLPRRRAAILSTPPTAECLLSRQPYKCETGG